MLAAAAMSHLQLGNPAAAHDILSRHSVIVSQVNSHQAQQLCSEALSQLKKKFDMHCLSVARLALELGPMHRQQLTEQLVMQCFAKGHLPPGFEMSFQMPVAGIMCHVITLQLFHPRRAWTAVVFLSVSCIAQCFDTLCPDSLHLVLLSKATMCWSCSCYASCYASCMGTVT